MKVRDQHINALALDKEKAFIREMSSHLNANFKEQLVKQGLEADQVESLVRLGISRAKTYEVTLKPDVQLFIECMVLFSPDFDENPDTSWAGEILRRSDIDGSQKMSEINDYMLFGLEEPV